MGTLQHFHLLLRWIVNEANHHLRYATSASSEKSNPEHPHLKELSALNRNTLSIFVKRDKEIREIFKVEVTNTFEKA